MPYRILLRRDNSAKWIQNDPVLMLGEPGYETDTGKLKIGDGQTPWSSLAYYNGLDLTVVNQLQLNSNELQLKDSQGNILSTVSFTVNNIQGLQTALDGKLDKGTYTGTVVSLEPPSGIAPDGTEWIMYK